MAVLFNPEPSRCLLRENSHLPRKERSISSEKMPEWIYEHRELFYRLLVRLLYEILYLMNIINTRTVGSP